MSIIKDSREATFVGKRTDGTRVQRPLSPHLQVYDMLQMTSGLSILNRATGIAWTIGMAFLVGGWPPPPPGRAPLRRPPGSSGRSLASSCWAG